MPDYEYLGMAVLYFLLKVITILLKNKGYDNAIQKQTPSCLLIASDGQWLVGTSIGTVVGWEPVGRVGSGKVHVPALPLCRSQCPHSIMIERHQRLH